MTSQNFLGYYQPTPSDAPQPEEPSSQDLPEQQQPPYSYTPQSVRPEDPEAPRMPNWKPNTAVYQGPAGSESVLKLMEDSDLNLDFLDANRDVLELFKSMGEGAPQFYVYNRPSSASSPLGLLFRPPGGQQAYRYGTCSFRRARINLIQTRCAGKI